MDKSLSKQRLWRILKHFSIGIKQGKKSTHFKLTATMDGVKHVYTIAVHKGEVDRVYIRALWRKFRLTPKHGITDEDFYGS